MDDPRRGDSVPGLVELIRDEILATPDERITFARYMELALTAPGLGYYATSELRPTREGDFLTAPELHPFFGRCIGRFLHDAWTRAGAPASYVVREYGAGRGTLRETAMQGLVADGSALAGDIVWRRVDLPDRREDVEDSDSLGVERVDVVLANEYLDALPVHRLIGQGDGIAELWVGWADGWFCEVVAEPSRVLVDELTAAGIALVPGQRTEVRAGVTAWMDEVAATLSESGALLVIDYGHEASELHGSRHMAGTLMTYRGHEVADDPFDAVGRRDITAHVDVTALEHAATAVGLELVGATTQARFLTALGLGDLLGEVGRKPETDAETYVAARAAVLRLLDPRHLGGFRVLAWTRPPGHGAVPTLAGFPAEG